MSDDLLERATRALRETSAPSADDLSETRARLLAGSRSARSQRARTLRWVLPLAAAFVTGSAFAATNGQLERVVRAVSTWLEAPLAPTAPAKPTKRPARPRSAPMAPAPEVLPSPAPQASAPTPAAGAAVAQGSGAAAKTSARPASPTHTPEASRARTPSEPSTPRDESRARDAHIAPETSSEPVERAAAPQSAPEATASAEPPASDRSDAPVRSPNPDLVHYREAHRLHFTLRNYREALSAWNAYLTQHPEGIFSQEARYNRAICLLHLKRLAEARVALEPFARGDVGSGYRRDQARALLEALPSTP